MKRESFIGAQLGRMFSEVPGQHWQLPYFGCHCLREAYVESESTPTGDVAAVSYGCGPEYAPNADTVLVPNECSTQMPKSGDLRAATGGHTLLKRFIPC